LIRKRGLRDLYFDTSDEAVTFSSQGHGNLRRLEPELDRLSYAMDEIMKAIEDYKPLKRAPMSTFDASLDESDPREHLHVLEIRLRQIASNLTGAAVTIADLQKRYRKLLAGE
jgi:hypothetical protein